MGTGIFDSTNIVKQTYVSQKHNTLSTCNIFILPVWNRADVLGAVRESLGQARLPLTILLVSHGVSHGVSHIPRPIDPYK